MKVSLYAANMLHFFNLLIYLAASLSVYAFLCRYEMLCANALEQLRE